MPGSRFLMWHVVVDNLPLSFDQRRRHWREPLGPAELRGTGVGLKGSGRCPVYDAGPSPSRRASSHSRVPRVRPSTTVYKGQIAGSRMHFSADYWKLYCFWKLNSGRWRPSNSSVIVCRTMLPSSCLLHNFARLVIWLLHLVKHCVLYCFLYAGLLFTFQYFYSPSNGRETTKVDMKKKQ